MRNLFICFIVFCLFSTGSLAQVDSIIFRFEIKDKVSKEPVPNCQVSVTWENQVRYEKSNHKGYIFAKLPLGSPILLSLSHPLYQSSTEKIKGNKSIRDTLFVLVEMDPVRVQNLTEIVVKSPGAPDTVFQSYKVSVADFEVQNDGSIVLLTYPKQLKKGSNLVLFDGKKVLQEFAVPGIAEELVRDYRGNTHVVCANNVYGIHVHPSRIGISTLPKDYFFKYLAPILDTTKSKLFFSNFSKDYPAFDYFSFDQLDSTYCKIIEIKDDLMMELFRSEYKWVDVRTKLWAKNMELETGVDAEILVGANYFTQSIYYKELYAPLFFRNDTVFVFDYYKDFLFLFDEKGEKLDSLAIHHHYHAKQTGWKKKLVQDPITGNFYAIFEKDGFTYIGSIDAKTGIIREKVRLHFKYVDKLKIHNNFVYYVYRPFESNQKKYLYKERLPYNFAPAKVHQGRTMVTETGK
jgi:hypothetical protein